FIISRSLARGLSMYVERRHTFSPTRRAEIARHLGQVLAQKLGYPTSINHDLLLCAMFQRAFHAGVAEAGAQGTVELPDLPLELPNASLPGLHISESYREQLRTQEV